MTRHITFAHLVLVTLTVAVSACGTSPRSVIRQGEGPTMTEVMRGASGAPAAQAPRSERHEPLMRASEYAQAGAPRLAPVRTRPNIARAREQFPTLPNRTIELHVHRHLVTDAATGEQHPVPGYTTLFPLYERVQYALPGELPATSHTGTGQFPGNARGDQDMPFSDIDGTEPLD